MKEYVRLTYLPSGAKRRRTVWAVVIRRGPKRVVYSECSEEGETVFDGGVKDGLPVEQRRLILATPEEVRECPARMNNKYALLEVVTYTAVFLYPGDHTKLVDWWQTVVGIPLLSKPDAHHMTIKFDPSEDEVHALPMAEVADFKVVGWAADERGQAVLVVPTGVSSANRHPHITMSCAPGTLPMYSNELLARGHTPADGPTLSGIIEVRAAV